MAVLSLNTNLASRLAQLRISQTSNSLERVFERLSSGQRINRASDDAAGLAIASSLNADSRVYSQAIRNGNDAISLLNIADGAASQMSGILTRLKELAEQSANGSYSDDQRLALDSEADALVDEFNRILASVEFNDRELLNGAPEDLTIQLGYGEDGLIDFDLGEELVRNVGSGGFADVRNIGNSDGKVLTADINGDGRLDIVTRAGTTIHAYTNDGDGSFTQSDFISNATQNDAFTLGDFNNDGEIDIMTTRGTTMSLYINDGTGNFSFDSSRAFSGTTLENADTGDFNGDGIDDFVFSDEGNEDLLIFTSSTSGAIFNNLYNVETVSLSGKGFALDSLVVGDLDGNGYDDIAIIRDLLDDDLEIFTNDGSSFTSQGTFEVGDSATLRNLRTGDSDGDGTDELLIGRTNSLDSFFYVEHYDFLAGDLTLRNTFEGSDYGEFGDLNGDGLVDIITTESATNGSANMFRSYFQNLDGTFQDPVEEEQGGAFFGFAIGDFTGDGVIDVAGSNGLSNLVVYDSYTVETTTTKYLDLKTVEGAREALESLDASLEMVARERGQIGATVSRIQAALGNLYGTRDNIKQAESRIIDADIAAETANLVRLQILQESAAAVMAQANAIPDLALQLLGN